MILSLLYGGGKGEVKVVLQRRRTVRERRGNYSEVKERRRKKMTKLHF